MQPETLRLRRREDASCKGTEREAEKEIDKTRFTKYRKCPGECCKRKDNRGRKKVKTLLCLTFVLSLCHTRSPSVRESAAITNRQSNAPCSLSVCVSMSVLAICPVSPPTINIAGIVLGWGHTSLYCPKRPACCSCLSVPLCTRSAQCM